MNFSVVKDKLKSNMVALRHQVVTSVHQNGVPAEFQVPQTQVRQCVQTAVTVATRTAPQQTFDELLQKAQACEDAIADIFEPLEESKRLLAKTEGQVRQLLSGSHQSTEEVASPTSPSPDAGGCFVVATNLNRAFVVANDELTRVLASLCRLEATS